jgi:hypothetical protein
MTGKHSEEINQEKKCFVDRIMAGKAIFRGLTD